MPLNPLSSCIIRLCSSVGPSTICWAVGSVIIDSVKAMSDWTDAHILQKLSGVIQPFLGHQDSSPSIVLEPWILWICASLFSCTISVGLFCFRPPMLTMADNSETATSLSVATRKDLAAHQQAFTAIALAEPLDSFSAVADQVRRTRYYRQPTIFQSGDVIQSRHGLSLP